MCENHKTCIIFRLVGACSDLSYLIFEDLSAKGYANVNRRTGFEIDDFRVVLKKAAKWHACTAVILEMVRHYTPKSHIIYILKLLFCTESIRSRIVPTMHLHK